MHVASDKYSCLHPTLFVLRPNERNTTASQEECLPTTVQAPPRIRKKPLYSIV